MDTTLSLWEDKTEITVEELAALAPEQVFLADIRDPAAFDRGTVPGAVNLNPLELQAGSVDLPEDKLIVLLCMWGKISLGLAANLRDQGWTAAIPCGSRRSWNGRTPWRRKIPSG